tara:strand:+ start:83 stop:316 length:234 start_codon:yes stop_codon:yes gene_type:complete
MNKIFKFKKIKKFLYRSTEILTLFIAISLLFGIIFGPETPVFGVILKNFSEIMNLFGENGLLALASLIIIFAILRRK